MNCVCYLSEMGIRTGAIISLGRTLIRQEAFIWSNADPAEIHGDMASHLATASL